MVSDVLFQKEHFLEYSPLHFYRCHQLKLRAEILY
jgi:hypothetical protein